MECSVTECGSPRYCKGYCRVHYVRWKRHGDPLHVGKRGPAKRICTIPGCDNGQAANGLCDKHRKRLDRYGDPLATKRIIGDIEARWWSHVNRRGDDECWPWTASTNEDGYGEFGVGPKVVGAHVWGYERFVEPVPPLMHLDHVKANGCTMRNCVNYLRHLEPVTNRENCLRGNRTKLSDSEVEMLYQLWWAGAASADRLALAAGVHKTTLYRRFRRLENASTPG